MSEEVKLTKVVADIPASPGDIGSEAMWAEPLGDDRYRLKNLPWFAYGLNLDDVVTCEEDDAGVPRISAVLEASGHRTLRVLFNDKAVSEDEQRDVLARLSELGVGGERASSDYLSLNVAPNVPYEPVASYLEGLQAEDKLMFEEAWAGEEAVPDAVPSWLED